MALQLIPNSSLTRFLGREGNEREQSHSRDQLHRLSAATRAAVAQVLEDRRPSPKIALAASGGTSASAIFVAQLYSNKVLKINSKGSIEKTISVRFQASSLATDGVGNLYVSAIAKEFGIEIYQAPTYSMYRRIELPNGSRAVGVTVDPRSGVIAVVSVHVRSNTEIYFYQNGDSKPCRVVQRSPNQFVFRGPSAFDRYGELYTYASSNNGDFLVSISGGCHDGHVTPMTFAQPFQIGPAFRFNMNDEFVIQALQPPNFYGPIYTFDHPKSGKFGLPRLTTNVPLYQGLAQSFSGLTSDGKHLIADASHEIAQYDYPNAGNPNWVTQGLGGVSSIAPVPALLP